ncbi:galaxin [Lingula anatina]|uniref:Galaxin n=1 Tax=Lingula anatina TaxID=7574 RepID=A0A1S3I7W5_LINAN|nr:galaxin [Lingula anatina]|eukprot:XP_013394288.1 galaxin [Lingula anatina]
MLLCSVLEISSNKACCDQNVYDTTSYTCCNQTLQPLTYGKDDSKCCGTQIYNKTSKTCCNDFQVVDNGTDCLIQSCSLRTCSKNGLRVCFTRAHQGDWLHGNCFDPNKQVCCKSSLFNKDSDDTECCEGVGIYNKSSHFCCNNQILSKADNPNLACCKGDGMEAVEGKVYNKLENICCNNALQPLTYGMGNTGCCGAATYNIQTRQCCGGQVLGLDTPCCGNAVLGDGQICCDNKPTLKRRPDDDTCCTGYSIGQVTTYNKHREKVMTKL